MQWNRLAITIIAFSMQISPPMPGQQMGSASQGGNKENDSGKRKNDNSRKAPPVMPEAAGTISEAAAKNVTPQDKEQSVKLTSLPPVTIAAKDKVLLDYVFDWGPWFFALLLVIVGSIQTSLLWGTLTKVKEQASDLKRQTDTIEAQANEARKAAADAAKVALATAKAAEKSAEAALSQIQLIKSKERAKLVIALKPFVPDIRDWVGSYAIHGTVSIYGSTEAYIERTSIYASIGEDGVRRPLPEWLFPIHLPPIIRSGVEPIEFATLVNANDGPASDDEILPVKEARDFIYCVASIEFSDVFGDQHEVRIQKRFRFFPRMFDTDTSYLGDWADMQPGQFDTNE